VFIYHFNRIIRNRFIWAFFVLLTVLAFVSVDSCLRGSDSGRTAGSVGGRAVSLEQFQTLEGYVRGFGRNRDNETPPSVVFTQTWERAAALELAGQLGAATTPTEIRQAVQEVPAFAEQGTFNAPRYRAVLREMMGITPPQYEAYLDHQITLYKIGQTVDAASWLSPMEVADELSGWTDRLTVQYATVSNQYAHAPMPVPAERMRKYYEENRRDFALPDRTAVRYVCLPVSNYLSSVSVADADVLDYYENHASDYTRTTASNTTEVVPLEQVRPEIVAALRMDEARYAAGTNATFSFVDSILKAEPNGFDKIATASKLPIRSTTLFGASDPLPGIESQTDFRNTAFELDPVRPDSRYGVVRGDTVIYVITPYTNDIARVPSFEEALDRVRPLAEADAKAEAFRNYLKDVHADIAATIKEGKAFAFAAKKQSLNVSTVLTFTVHSLKRDAFENAYAVVSASMPLRRGEISEGVNIPGGALIAYMADRAAGDAIEVSMMRDPVRAALARRREGVLFGDWMAWHLARTGYKPDRSIVPLASTGDTGSDE
jgi:hypothetical protein